MAPLTAGNPNLAKISLPGPRYSFLEGEGVSNDFKEISIKISVNSAYARVFDLGISPLL